MRRLFRNNREDSADLIVLTTGINSWITLLATGSDRRVTLSEDKVSHSAAPVVNKACPLRCDWPAGMSARATGPHSRNQIAGSATGAAERVTLSWTRLTMRLRLWSITGGTNLRQPGRIQEMLA